MSERGARIDLSIIIVTWNSREDIEPCLRSVFRNSPRLSREVVVIDNASKDGTVHLIEEKFPTVRIIGNRHNVGFARAVNQGLRSVKGNRILLLNPDTVIIEEALGEMARLLEEREDVGAVAPQLLNPDGSVQPSCRRFPTPASFLWEIIGLNRLFPRSPRFNGWKMGDFDHRTPREVDQPMASCIMVEGEVVARIGPMDERFPMFFNDVDWCLRMQEAGWKIYFLPSARVTHSLGASTRRRRTRMIFSSHKSAIDFLRKYARRPLARLALIPVSILLMVAGLVRIFLDLTGEEWKR